MPSAVGSRHEPTSAGGGADGGGLLRRASSSSFSDFAGIGEGGRFPGGGVGDGRDVAGWMHKMQVRSAGALYEGFDLPNV